ncbi:MAG: OmpA family protein [Oscillospiraceae bacterium]|nr:OmpA family protein [Oscillospiraceae bacterium]
MRKILCMLLALAMVLSMSACGSVQDLLTTDPSDETEATQDVNQDTSATVDPTQGSDETPTDGETIPEDDVSDDPGATEGSETATEPPVDLEIATVYRPIPVDDTPVSVSDFTMTYSSVAQFKAKVSANADEFDMALIDDLNDEQIAGINNTRAEVIYDLYRTFAHEGMTVTMDKATGVIAFDSSILFEDDSAELSTTGQEFLAKFIDLYTTVLFHEKYIGFAYAIMIEGHTDSSGDYDQNLALSQARAERIKAYVLEEELHLSQEYVERLNETLIAAGRADDVPALHASGAVNAEASNRISFRFMMNFY